MISTVVKLNVKRKRLLTGGIFLSVWLFSGCQVFQGPKKYYVHLSYEYIILNGDSALFYTLSGEWNRDTLVDPESITNLYLENPTQWMSDTRSDSYRLLKRLEGVEIAVFEGNDVDYFMDVDVKQFKVFIEMTRLRTIYLKRIEDSDGFRTYISSKRPDIEIVPFT